MSPSRSAIMVLALFGATSCYTTTNNVRLKPVETEFPVSASPQYRDAQGQIVTEDDYDVVRSFKVTHRFEVPPHTEKVQAFNLTPDLTDVMQQGGGEALTNVKIEGIDYNTGSHGSAAAFKIMGWSFGLIGAPLLGMGLAIDDDVGKPLAVTGGIFAGLGILSYVIGVVQRDPAYWTFDVSGDVVQRKSAPVSR